MSFTLKEKLNLRAKGRKSDASTISLGTMAGSFRLPSLLDRYTMTIAFERNAFY